MSKQEDSRRDNHPGDQQSHPGLKNHRKVKSVLELGRYNIGNVAWWVVFRCANQLESEHLPNNIQWMLECHPKEMYTRGPLKKLWNRHTKLPKLHHQDFLSVVPMLVADLVVEQFNIKNITRSTLTGEYYYGNTNDEWMPQSSLFDTKAAACKERNRIVQMLKTWIKNISPPPQ